MSNNQFIQRSQKLIEQDPQQQAYLPVIDVFQPQFISQKKAQQKVRKFYYPLEFPCYGDYPQPDLRDIEQMKKKHKQNFVQSQENSQKQRLVSLDGTYEGSVQVDQSSKQIIRQKARMARDAREEFFQRTGEFVVQKEFFQEQMARLANISFDQNISIKTFHKNAILSERNNQKKSTSFQLMLNFGGIFLNKHALQNQQQQKFQQIRPLMKEWSVISTYPILPELSKQIEYLKQMRQHVAQNAHEIRQKGQQQLLDLQKKLRVFEDVYDHERKRIQELARNITNKWRQMKQIRTRTGIQTVPWKFNVKQYEIKDPIQRSYIKNYDIGMTPFQLSPISNSESSLAVAEQKRRQLIKQQKYFIKIYINDHQVAKTEKFNLQWPSFKVPIQELVSITVYSAPYKMSLEIVKFGLINHVVDTVNITLPGVNAKTITAAEKKYAAVGFAQNGKQTRSKKQKEEPKAPAGTILYIIQWKGQGSRMPPSYSAKAAEQETQSTEASQTMTQTKSQGQITQKQAKELFDIRDPRRQHKTMKQKVQLEINLGTNNLLPFVNVQSTRLLLFRLRARISQLQRIQIPLLEEEIQKREDLQQILNREKRRNTHQEESKDHKFFHPCENKYFNEQTSQIVQQIRNLLTKIQGLKLFTSSRGLVMSSLKYKIAQQIINEHIFERMDSPIVIFFRNFFTQRRKLGAQSTYKPKAKINVEQFEVNIHVRSARHLPIRSSSQLSIKQYEKEEQMMGGFMNNMMNMGMGIRGNGMGGNGMGGNGMYPQQGGMYPNNRQMYQGYGRGLYNQAPNIAMNGMTFFNQNPNIPNRMNQQASYEGKTVQRVNSVVQLKFKRNLCRTKTFQGPFPEWNQTLAFKYSMKHENSSIQKIFYNNQKVIKMLIFDITEESKPTNAIARIQIKKTKYFLGRIQIPFSLITVLPSLSGIWKLERPLVIFSYTIMKKMFSNQGASDRSEEMKTDTPTYMNIDLFTQPAIQTLIAYNTDRKFIVGPQENPLLLQKASDWLQDLNTQRYVKLWLNDIDQRSIFICRYLSRNVSPPNWQYNQIQRSARFVSLLPRKYNCHLLQNTQQFHLRVDELLQLKMGQDHGILLCNYFNYLDVKNASYESYLILGKAFPYGKSTFVLRRDKTTNDCQVWDPFKGECYAFPAKQVEITCFCIKTEKKQQINYNNRDICPLFEATCVVSMANVYVNRQQSTSPYLIDFNLEDADSWTSFLTERTRTQYYNGNEIPTIQPEVDQDYYAHNFPEDKDLPMRIQQQLYEFIKKKIQEQRKNHFTPLVFKLNQKASKKIGDTLLLQQCETFKSDYRMSGKQSKMYDIRQYNQGLSRLQKQKDNIQDTVIDSDKNLFGFTLNSTYTTNEEVWQKIEDTQIHLDQNQNIEFVLSVRCFPYACHLFSVWIFIGTIQ